jgi:hypothetical protein
MASERIIKVTDGGELRLYEDKENGRNFVALKAAPDIVSDYEISLPAGQGTDGEVLTADGVGGTRWGNSAATLNTAYHTGAQISADSGKIEILKTDNTETIYIYKSSTGAGDILKVLNEGTGKDIAGTSDTWTVSKAGAAVFTDVDTTTASVDTLTVNTEADVPVVTSASTNFEGNVTINGPNPWYDVRSWGAVGNGVANDTTAFQNAIDAATTAGGTVYVPPGTYLLTGSLALKNKVHLLGSGVRASFLSSTVAGVAISLNGTQYASIRNLTLGLGVNVTHGIQVKNNGVTSNGSYNSISGIEIWASTLTAGQIGLAVQSDSDGDATFNHFRDFVIYSIAKPVYSYDAEANVYSSFTIDTFGTGATAYGVETYSHAENYSGFWFGRGTSAATTLVCFKGTPDSCYINGVADVGTGKFADLTGASGNFVQCEAMGTTTKGLFGTAGNYLGAQRETAISAYQANVMGRTGVSSDLLQVGVDSVTNGLTVQYNDGTGRMVYTFAGGDITSSGSLAANGLSLTPKSRTIASDAITIDGTYGTIYLSPETTADDNLANINTAAYDGQVIVLVNVNETYKITVHRADGNITMAADTHELNTRADRLVLQWDATLTKWCEVSYVNNP